MLNTKVISCGFEFAVLTATPLQQATSSVDPHTSVPQSLLGTSHNCRSSEIHCHVCLQMFVLAGQIFKKLL